MLVEPADRRIPYQPAAAARRTAALVGHRNADRTAARRSPRPRDARRCAPHQLRPGRAPDPSDPGLVTILDELNHVFRVIPMDGRPHVPGNVKLWMGDSRGRWEGNTLVVDVTNFNDQTWFDSHGSFHSDALHVVERWTMVGADRIDYEATLEDAKAFTRPWKITFAINRNKAKDYEIYEDTRLEGERDVEEIILGGKVSKAAGRTRMHNAPAGRVNPNQQVSHRPRTVALGLQRSSASTRRVDWRSFRYPSDDTTRPSLKTLHRSPGLPVRHRSARRYCSLTLRLAVLAQGRPASRHQAELRQSGRRERLNSA